MAYYLVVYDRPQGELLSLRSFDDGREALAARLEHERTTDNEDLEVVVLAADSESELRVTHGRYFNKAGVLVDGMLKQSKTPPKRISRARPKFLRRFATR